jgi:endonuclease G
MAERDQERLKNYVELLKRAHGGADPLIEVAKASRRGGFEKLGGPADAGAAIEAVELNRELPPEQYFGLEAIIAEEIRPAFDIIDGTFSATHRLWTKLSTDAVLKSRIESAIPSVGRLELPGNRRYPYGGTGFVVGENLIMTNRHVAEIFGAGLGNRNLKFISGERAGIDFLRESGRPPGKTLSVVNIVMIHPYWDMAILKVDGLAGHAPIKLSLKDARELPVGREVFVIGYPAYDPRNPDDAQKQVFDDRYGIKRLQPGALQGAGDTASFGKIVRAAAHDCSTLGGNSGSAIFDLASGEVLALHFGGQYHEKNFGVPSSEMSRDSRIVDTGISFSDKPPGDPNGWSDWWSRADAAERDEVAMADNEDSDDAGGRQTPPPVSFTSPALAGGGGSVTFEVPLRITISLGAPGAPALSVSAGSEAVTAGLEGLQMPFHDDDYSNRQGYDPSFLGDALAVPMPAAADPAVLARVQGGGTVLHYQNFSICMHAKRRIALFTASNVTEEEKLRKPEKNKLYSRKGLSGLGKNDQEKWFPDPRLDAGFQLPDVFFTKDRKAFDKGHIVRRDDVAWGRTYEEVRRANGDSYHVTNCSPQVAGFNRSNLGEDNWGDLENHVLSEAASERLCVFAGPVLDSADRVFVGAGDGSTTLRARIPSRFWKLIVARVEDGIAAYAFLLEQDLSDVEWEFAVSKELAPFLYPISDLQEIAGVKFDKSIVDADQYETSRGAEVGRRAGAKRKRKKP